VVIVLSTGPKVLREDDGFLRAIIICSMTSFGGEVKPSAPRLKSFQHVENPCGV
jgi:hypothetical protein